MTPDEYALMSLHAADQETQDAIDNRLIILPADAAGIKFTSESISVSFGNIVIAQKAPANLNFVVKLDEWYAVPKPQQGKVSEFGRKLKATYHDGWSRMGWDNSHGSISPKEPLAAFCKCYNVIGNGGGEGGYFTTIEDTGSLRFSIASNYLDKFNACTNMVVRLDNIPYDGGICYEIYTIKKASCQNQTDSDGTSCQYYVTENGYSYSTNAPYGGFNAGINWIKANMQVKVTFE